MKGVMEPLVIEQTPSMPAIRFDRASGLFEIEGNSYPENAFKFYQPAIQWLSRYAKDPLPETHFSFKLDYFNSASSKSLIELLQILAWIRESGHKISIAWYYRKNDDDMQYAGEELSDMVQLPFEFLSC